jgi:hypothetical protein
MSDVIKPIKRMTRRAIQKFGYDIIDRPTHPSYPPGFSDEVIGIIERVQPYTVTSHEKIAALIASVKYIVENNIAGDFVECGVWRGGSMMTALYTLLMLGVTDRTVYLYDTYYGMTPPTKEDVQFDGTPAAELLPKVRKHPNAINVWCWANLEDVMQNVLSTGYPKERIHFIEGDVAETIPRVIPEEIALLRLDTDFYASTKHELTHLYPRLCSDGVLIIDDYGHWEGARKAVDEYFSAQEFKPLLHRIDFSGRCVIKR